MPAIRERLPGLIVGFAAGAAALLLAVGPLPALGITAAVALFAELLQRRAPLMAPTAEPSAPPSDDYAPLSKREAEVAGWVARGLTNREIASRLFRSERVIDNHVQHCYKKLGIHNRVELTHWAIERGLLSLEDPKPGPPSKLDPDR